MLVSAVAHPMSKRKGWWPPRILQQSLRDANPEPRIEVAPVILAKFVNDGIDSIFNARSAAFAPERRRGARTAAPQL